MGFDSKTLAQLVETEKDEYRSRIPEADLAEGSDFDIEARVHAAAVHGNSAHAAYLARQVLPDTADADFLLRHADLRGVTKRVSTAASGRITLKLDGGSPPITQPSGSVITDGPGRTYTTQEDGIVALPTWTGKTTAAGMTLTRVQVIPDVSGMERGHRVSLPTAGERTIIRVLPSIQAIEVDPPFDAVIAAGFAISPIASAFVASSADATGSGGNHDAGDTGTLGSPTAGLSATAEFVEMTGGADAETNDELRQDVLAVMAVHPGGGNLEQWRRWTLATPGVGLGEAFVYPGLRGLGTMTVVPFGPSDARAIGAERNAEILAYLQDVYPFDDDLEVLAFSYVGAPQNIVLSVEPGTGFEPDWSGAPILLHNVTASTTTRIQLLNAADLALIQVGDRVVVPIVASGLTTTEQRVVQGKRNAGTDDYQVDLSVALSAAPALGESLYSGGPLYQAIVDELTDYFDELGPGDTSPVSRWPRSTDTFQGDILIAEIIRRVKGLTGVRNVSLTTPSADVVTPTMFVQRLGEVRPTWT
jgi:uncharacterized phage protein gp47/JayE